MQKISWTDIFALDDKTTITEAIAVIQQLKQVYEGMIQSVQNSNQQLNSNIVDLKGQCDALSTSIKSIGTNFDGNKTLIIDAASQSQKLVDQYGSLIKAQNDNALSLDNLNKTYNTLSESQDNVKKKMSDQAGSLGDLKIKIDEAVKSYKSLGDATDQTVKDAQLQKIKDLNTQYLSLNKVLTDAKKATDVATGSYQDLQRKVADATKEIKAMEGGMDSQGKKFQELQKFVKDGNDKLKDFDKALGVSQREVGNYEKATEGLKGEFEGLLGKLGESGEKIEGIGNKAIGAWNALKGMATGVAGVTAAAGAFIGASLAAYFTRTSEGALQLFETTSKLEYKWIEFQNALAQAGKFIVENAGHFKETTDAAQKAFEENELLGRKLIKSRLALEVEESGEELKKNELIFNSRNKLKFTDEERLEMAKEALKIQQELSEKATEQAQAEADQQTKSIVTKSGRGSVQNLGAEDAEKVVGLLKAVDDAKEKAFSGTRRLQAQIVQITEELYNREKELAKEELEVEKGINVSRVQSDMEKNNAILNNLKATEDQRKQALIKNAQDERAIASSNKDLAVSEATVKTKERIRTKTGAENFDAMPVADQQGLINADKVLADQKLKIEIDYLNKVAQINNNLTRSLIDNENKFAAMRIDHETKLISTNIETEKAISQSTIEFNQKILNSDDATYEERNQAIKKIGDERIKILGNDTDKAIELATAEAKKKILIDGFTQQHNEELEGQRTALLAKYEADVDKVNSETIKAVKENVFTALNRDLANLTNKAGQMKSQALEDLANEYKDGNITIKQYEFKRQGIIREFEIQQANDVITMYENILKNTQLSEKQRTDIQAKAAAAREKATELEVNFSIQKRKALNSALVQLGNEALNAAKELSSSNLQNLLDENQKELDQLNVQKDARLAIVGGDRAAEARINQEFNKKQQALQKEANAAKRKDAIFQKEISAIRIIMDTAIGVGGAIAQDNIPLAFIIGAIGAIELALVLSQKIPSYAKGTESAKEGLSLVGEAGREIGHSNGKTVMYDKPTLTYLERGTKIFNNSETERIMESLGTIEDVKSVYKGIKFNQSKGQMIAVIEGNKEIVDTMKQTSREMIKAMGKGGDENVWDETGYHRYTRDKNARIERLDKRYTLGG